MVIIALLLLTISMVLFFSTRKGWINDLTLQRLANVAAIVALIAAVTLFVFPEQKSDHKSDSTKEPSYFSNDSSSITLTFIVWEKGTDKPVKNAIVDFIEPPSYGQKPTDSNGQVNFDILYDRLPINAQIKIEHPGYHSITRYIRISRGIEVQRFFLEKKLKNVKPMSIIKTCTFEGRVIDTEGNPIAGAKLTFDGGRGEGVSGNSGNFRIIVNAPPGEEIGLLVEKEGYQTKYDFVLLPGPVTIQMSMKK